MLTRLTRPDDVSLLPDIERAAAGLFRDIADLAWVADDSVLAEDQHRGFVESGCSWVAVDDKDRPTGFIVVEPCDDGLHIVEVSVHPSAQGQGLGRALLDRAYAQAAALGLPAVTLTTFRDVPWNEPFYARRGFVTLAIDRIPPRLKALLDSELEHGFPAGRRCAMVRPVATEPAGATGI